MFEEKFLQVLLSSVADFHEDPAVISVLVQELHDGDLSSEIVKDYLGWFFSDAAEAQFLLVEAFYSKNV